jgi:tetratricopeptide (TPR) repeat protein
VLTEQARAEDALHPLTEARRRIDASTALAALAGVVAPQRYHEGQARRRLGQLQVAEHCYAEALALTSGPDGSADPAIRAGAGLALTLALQGRLPEAQEKLDQARSLQKEADLRGFSQSLMLAEAEAAIALARHDIGALGSPWQSLKGDELFSGRLGEPGPQVLKVLATWAEKGPDAAADAAMLLLASLQAGAALPNRDYEVGKLRGLIANHLAPR